MPGVLRRVGSRAPRLASGCKGSLAAGGLWSHHTDLAVRPPADCDSPGEGSGRRAGQAQTRSPASRAGLIESEAGWGKPTDCLLEGTDRRLKRTDWWRAAIVMRTPGVAPRRAARAIRGVAASGRDGRLGPAVGRASRT